MPSALRDNLRTVYSSHGGLKSVATSGYAGLAVIISLLNWRRVEDDSWITSASSILPNLLGFSIAAFALLFAVLNENERRALRAPSEELNGRSPLLTLASTITHAAIVQTIALVVALTFSAKPFPNLNTEWSVAVNLIISGAGLLLFIYALMLLLAAILTVFKVLELTSRA